MNMEEITNNYKKEAEELFDKKKFEEILILLTDKVLEEQKSAELFLYRGIGRYYNKDYNNAIADYTKAIDINIKHDFAEAYYNRGLALVAKKEYKDAIADFNKVIDLDPKYLMAYDSRGSIKRVMEKYDQAIVDYNNALRIDPNDENVYYNRGLAYYYKGLKVGGKNVDLKRSKQDFEKYQNLTSDENDIGFRYAKYYLKKLDEIKDIELSNIAVLVSKIKEILRFEEDCITHYTSLSAMKILILADNSKLWISEGNFMNDPSEGTELFSFLYGEDKRTDVETTEVETFVPKPFIGSFVTKVMNNDLNMWRFYGKEDGVEAKGCAIVLRKQKFIEDIKNSLSNEKNKEARIDDESDISFYQVVYLPHKSADFKIPNLEHVKVEEFKDIMNVLKEKVNSYKGANQTNLKEYLNNIAFLFKRADYKNENEVRLVMNGIEFEKKYRMDVIPPRVYIELEPIKEIVKQITLGPKVDKANEWASALHYSYKEEEKTPEIRISHLPYK